MDPESAEIWPGDYNGSRLDLATAKSSAQAGAAQPISLIPLDRYRPVCQAEGSHTPCRGQYSGSLPATLPVLYRTALRVDHPT